MFAKRWEQNREILSMFDEVINLKQEKEKSEIVGNMRKKTIGLSWFMEPAIKSTLDEENFKKKISGNSGENSVDLSLWLWLPHSYNIFHSVVLNPTNNLFIQIDHLVVSNSGIFIIETKNWKGYVEGSEEEWRKITKYRGLEIMKNNPYKEQLFHAKIFKLWCQYNLRNYYGRINSNTFPIIIFEGCSGLKANGPIPVFKGTQGALWYILKTGKRNLFSNQEIFDICKKIKEAKPKEM